MKSDDFIKLAMSSIAQLNRQVQSLDEDVKRMSQLHKLQDERMQYLFIMVQLVVSRSEQGLSWEEVERIKSELSQLQASAAEMERDFNNLILNDQGIFHTEDNEGKGAKTWQQ